MGRLSRGKAIWLISEGAMVGATLGAMVLGIWGGVLFGHVDLKAGQAAAWGLGAGGLVGGLMTAAWLKWRPRR